MKGLLRNPYAPAVTMIFAVCLFPLVASSNFQLRLATVLFFYSVVTLGLNLLMGYAGQVSLCQAAFFAIGAYAVAIGPAHLAMPAWASLVIGTVATGGIAYIIGRPILRLSGYYLAMATLAFGAIVSIVLNNEVALTGGPDGMQVARLYIAGFRFIGISYWYWTAGALLVVVMLAIANILRSPTGRALRAIHDSELAANVLGIDVARYKLIAFVISAVFASLAGSGLAFFDGHITPVAGGISRSIEFLTMAVIGGLGSIMGSIVGAAFLVVLPQVLTSFQEYEHAILGAILVLTMVLLPTGFIPSLVSAIERRMR